MALWVCLGCGAFYAVGAPRCPQCTATEWVEEGQMPKITRHGGPTNAAADMEEGEQPSPGSPTSPSSSSPQLSEPPTPTDHQPPAPTTAPSSNPPPTEGSSAASTAGPTPETGTDTAAGE